MGRMSELDMAQHGIIDDKEVEKNLESLKKSKKNSDTLNFEKPRNEYERVICQRIDGTQKPQTMKIDLSRIGDQHANDEYDIKKIFPLKEFDVPGFLIEGTFGQAYWSIFPEKDEGVIEIKLFPLKSKFSFDNVKSSLLIRKYSGVPK